MVLESIKILVFNYGTVETKISNIIQNMNLDKTLVSVARLEDIPVSLNEFNIIIILSSQGDKAGIPLINQLMTKNPTASLIYIPETPQMAITRYCLQQNNGYFLPGDSIELLPDFIYQILAKKVKAEEHIAYLKEQQQMIFHLANQAQSMEADWQDTLQKITRATAETKGTARASIWLYNNDNKSIICQMLYDAKKQTYEKGMELSSSDYPGYFKALEENRVIVADDAHRNEATCEFSGNYLDEHGIVSMLDAPIRLQGRMVGVVCCEHTGDIRRWTHDDEQFSGAIADMVALKLEHRERRRAEDALRKRENYLKEAEAIAHLGNFEANLIDRTVVWSDEIYRIFGYERGTIEPTWDIYESLLTAEEYEQVMAKVYASVERQEPYYLEHDIHLKDGTVKHIYAMGRPVRDDDGTVRKIFGIMQDITDRKITENQRIELELNQQKVAFLQEFIDSMTHDLKIPLASIKSNAYLIKRVEDQAKRGEYLERLDTQVDRLHKMIDDILMVSRLEYLPELHFHRTNLNDLIHEVARQVQATIIKKNIQLTLDLSSQPMESSIARDEFLRALLNLVENAVNYTPEEGQVTIRSYYEGNRKAIDVIDTGIGIPAKDIPHIFEQFYRAGNAVSFHAGTGLGLAIVKKIIDHHRGEIQIMSDASTGTRISILLA